MRRVLQAGTLSVALCTIATQGAQAAYIEDQVSGFIETRPQGNGFGQSFRPTLNGIDEIIFAAAPVGSQSVTIHLDLFDGAGFGGTLLGSTGSGTYDPGTLDTAKTLTFAQRIALTPGNTYTFRIVGSSDYTTFASAFDFYSRGRFYTGDGVANAAGRDLLFSEGIIEPAAAVPEAGTWGMLLVGLGAIGIAMRRRRRGASLGPA